jgi:hypothetical protein
MHGRVVLGIPARSISRAKNPLLGKCLILSISNAGKENSKGLECVLVPNIDRSNPVYGTLQILMFKALFSRFVQIWLTAHREYPRGGRNNPRLPVSQSSKL